MTATVSLKPILTPGRVCEIVESDTKMLVKYYSAMPADKQREFWQLRGGRADKLMFLLRWGAFEQGVPIQLCN